MLNGFTAFGQGCNQLRQLKLAGKKEILGFSEYKFEVSKLTELHLTYWSDTISS